MKRSLIVVGGKYTRSSQHLVRTVVKIANGEVAYKAPGSDQVYWCDMRTFCRWATYVLGNIHDEEDDEHV